MKILLTGPAGFIGSHVLDRLLAEGHQVVGVDNFDPFYSRAVKNSNIAAHLDDEARGEGRGARGEGEGGCLSRRSATETDPQPPQSVGEVESSSGGGGTPQAGTRAERVDWNGPQSGVNSGGQTAASFDLVEGDLADETTYTKIDFIAESLNSNLPRSGDNSNTARSGVNSNPPAGGFDAIIHLAAKAGVRPSIEDPVGYQRANVIATQNLLEYARKKGIRQFVFASSSSVYGVNPRVPWREDDTVLQPISPYASTKVSCELLGHVYSKLYGIRFLALRFFTVYGPRQRPDLAIHKFTRKILDGEPIPVFGDGSTRRDYTYVSDIVDGIIAAVTRAVESGPPEIGQPDNRERGTGELKGGLPPYEVINLGNDQTVTLAEMIATIEEATGKKANIDRQPEQPGDVPQTWADISKARELLGYEPKTAFREGVGTFVEWLRGGAAGTLLSG